jgi:predicted DNA binding CopG/RHH family protein
MTKKVEPDAEEQAMLAAYEKGEFKPVKQMKTEIAHLRDAASQYLRKDARINIRLSESDLLMLKRKAAEEGMPYQTLIASVLHKFVSGRL